MHLRKPVLWEGLGSVQGGGARGEERAVCLQPARREASPESGGLGRVPLAGVLGRAKQGIWGIDRWVALGSPASSWGPGPTL